MANNIMLAPVGDEIDALFIGIREYPTQRVVLITPPEEKENAEKAKKDLERFKIPATIEMINGNMWEEMFRIVGEISRAENNMNVIMNVATGDKMTSCAATSAAFVNGIKAMGVKDDMAMLLPVLKFSYYKILTEKKMSILKFIFDDKNCCASLEELSKKTSMSLPLVSYHVNGNLKSDGLKDLGLVDTTEHQGKTAITLTTLGRMLIKGYV
ncbi:DUF6293 family protein [Nanoarchaeota archaeon]